MLPLSFDLALEIQRFRKLMEEHLKSGEAKRETLKFIQEFLHTEKNTSNAVFEYFKQQFLFSEIPHLNKLLIEHYADGGIHYYLFHSTYGRRVNDALSRALAFALGKIQHKDIGVGMDDNGFILSSNSGLMIEKALGFFKTNDFKQICVNSIENSEVLKRRFRHCAGRALMIIRNYKGREKPVGRQQVSAQILINAVRALNPDFPILKEARREVLEDLMDIESALLVIDGIEKGKIKIKQRETSLPSPFSWQLFSQGLSDLVKMEDRLNFIKRMHELVEKKIAEKELKEKNEREKQK